uniref:Uncharacterized protein n=1 Tax=Parascaris univalens TaxID=6257 RepID=A0A914ZR50_PARUN
NWKLLKEVFIYMKAKIYICENELFTFIAPFALWWNLYR